MLIISRASAALLLLIGAAHADGIYNPGDVFTFPAVSINPATYGAKGNTKNYSNGVMTAASAVLTSASNPFTSADVGKAISVDGAGAAGVPLVTTILSYQSAGQVTLAAPASTSVPFSVLATSNISTAQSGAGSYAPGDTITLAGGTFSTAGIVTVTTTKIVSIAQNANGSGGTTGACTVTGTTGSALSGQLFQAAVTITAGAISAVGAITRAGIYTTNPTSIAAEPVTGCGLTGATLTLVTGVNTVNITTGGVYSVTTAAPTQGSTSGNGTGVVFAATFNATGTFYYGNDDTAGLTAAWNAYVAIAASGGSACIEPNPGTYFVSASMPTTSAVPLCVVGQQTHGTIFYLSPAMSGVFIETSDTWQNGNYPFNGNTLIGFHEPGAFIRNIMVTGNRSATSEQDAFVFADHTDFLYFENVEVDYLNGRCLYAAPQLNDPTAYFRESTINNVRCFHDGQAGVPVFEIWATSNAGNSSGSNEIDIHEINIYYSGGIGAIFHGNTGTGITGQIRIANFRVEGEIPNGPVSTGDLLQIGDSTYNGPVSNLNMYGVELVNPPLGYAAVHFTATSFTYQNYDDMIDGHITTSTGLGRCIQIDYGRDLYLHFSTASCYDYDLQVASTAGANLVVDVNNAENTLTTNIGGGEAAQVFIPVHALIADAQKTWEAPAAIGSTTPNTGEFTALGVNQAAPSTFLLGVTGTTQTGSSANGIVSLSQTYNTSGNPTAFTIAITDTAVGNNSTASIMNLLTGASGTTSAFRVDLNGAGTFGGGVTAGTNFNAAATGSVNWTGRGILTSPSAATVQHGAADAATAVSQTIQAQSVVAGTSNTAGANMIIVGSRGTGTGPSGNILIEVGKTGSTGSTQNTAYPLISANAGNATGATVQLGDGTNFTTYDSCTALTTGATGIIACTASAMRFKHLLFDEWVTPVMASAGLDVLREGAPVWEYDDQERFGHGHRVGLIANDVERMDQRCVVTDNEGVKDYWDRCVLAYLSGDRQNLWKYIRNMESKIERLERRVQ